MKFDYWSIHSSSEGRHSKELRCNLKTKMKNPQQKKNVANLFLDVIHSKLPIFPNIKISSILNVETDIQRKIRLGYLQLIQEKLPNGQKVSCPDSTDVSLSSSVKDGKEKKGKHESLPALKNSQDCISNAYQKENHELVPTGEELKQLQTHFTQANLDSASCPMFDQSQFGKTERYATFPPPKSGEAKIDKLLFARECVVPSDANHQKEQIGGIEKKETMTFDCGMSVFTTSKRKRNIKQNADVKTLVNAKCRILKAKKPLISYIFKIKGGAKPNHRKELGCKVTIKMREVDQGKKTSDKMCSFLTVTPDISKIERNKDMLGEKRLGSEQGRQVTALSEVNITLDDSEETSLQGEEEEDSEEETLLRAVSQHGERFPSCSGQREELDLHKSENHGSGKILFVTEQDVAQVRESNKSHQTQNGPIHTSSKLPLLKSKESLIGQVLIDTMRCGIPSQGSHTGELYSRGKEEKPEFNKNQQATIWESLDVSTPDPSESKRQRKTFTCTELKSKMSSKCVIRKARKTPISQIFNILGKSRLKHLPSKILKSQNTDFLIHVKYSEVVEEDLTAEQKEGLAQEFPAMIPESLDLSTLALPPSKRNYLKSVSKRNKMSSRCGTLKAKKASIFQTFNISKRATPSYGRQFKCNFKIMMEEGIPVADILLNSISSAIFSSFDVNVNNRIKVETDTSWKMRFCHALRQQEQSPDGERAWWANSRDNGVSAASTVKEVQVHSGEAAPCNAQHFSFKARKVTEPHSVNSDLELKTSARKRIPESPATAQGLRQQTLSTQHVLHSISHSILNSLPSEKLPKRRKTQTRLKYTRGPKVFSPMPAKSVRESFTVTARSGIPFEKSPKRELASSIPEGTIRLQKDLPARTLKYTYCSMPASSDFKGQRKIAQIPTSKTEEAQIVLKTINITRPGALSRGKRRDHVLENMVKDISLGMSNVFINTFLSSTPALPAIKMHKKIRGKKDPLRKRSNVKRCWEQGEEKRLCTHSCAKKSTPNGTLKSRWQNEKNKEDNDILFKAGPPVLNRMQCRKDQNSLSAQQVMQQQTLVPENKAEAFCSPLMIPFQAEILKSNPPLKDILHRTGEKMSGPKLGKTLLDDLLTDETESTTASDGNPTGKLDVHTAVSLQSKKKNEDIKAQKVIKSSANQNIPHTQLGSSVLGVPCAESPGSKGGSHIAKEYEELQRDLVAKPLTPALSQSKGQKKLFKFPGRKILPASNALAPPKLFSTNNKIDIEKYSTLKAETDQRKVKLHNPTDQKQEKSPCDREAQKANFTDTQNGPSDTMKINVQQNKGEAGKETIHLTLAKHEERKMQGSKDEPGELLTQSYISLPRLPNHQLGKEMEGISNAGKMVYPEPMSVDFMKDVQKQKQHMPQKKDGNREKPVAMRGMTHFTSITLKSKKSPPSYTLHRTELHVNFGRQGQEKCEGQGNPPGSVLRKVYVLKPPTNLKLHKGTQVDEEQFKIKRHPLFPQIVSALSDAEEAEATESTGGGVRKTNEIHLQKEKNREQNKMKVKKDLLHITDFFPSQLQLPGSSGIRNTKYKDSSEGTSSCNKIIKASQHMPHKDAKDRVNVGGGKGRILPKTITLSVETSPLTQLLSRKRLCLNSKEQVRIVQKDQGEPEIVLRKTYASLPSLSNLKWDTRMNEKEDTLGKTQLCFPPLKIQDSPNSGKKAYTRSLEGYMLKEEDRFKTDIEDKMLPIYINLKAKKLPLPQVFNAKKIQSQIEEQKGKLQKNKKKIVTNIKSNCTTLLPSPYLRFDTAEREVYMVTNTKVPLLQLYSRKPTDAVKIAHPQTIDQKFPNDAKEFKNHTQQKEEKDTEKTMDMNIVVNPNDMYLDVKTSSLLLKHNLSNLQRKTKEQERKVHKVTCKPAGIMLNKACSSHSSSPQLNTNIRDKGKSMVTLTSPSVSAVHFQDSSASQEVVSVEPIICHSLFSLWEEKPCMHQSKKQVGVQTLNLTFLKNEEKKMQGSKDEQGVLLTQSSISLSCLPHPQLGKEMHKMSNAQEIIHPEPMSGHFMKDFQSTYQHMPQKGENDREKMVALRGRTHITDITLKSKKSPPSYILHRTELHVHIGRQGQEKHQGHRKPPGSVLRKVYALKPPTNLQVNKGTQVDEEDLEINSCLPFPQMVSELSVAEKIEGSEAISGDAKKNYQHHLQKEKGREQNKTTVDKGLLEIKGFCPSQLQISESLSTKTTKYADSSKGTSSCNTIIEANQHMPYKYAKNRVKVGEGKGRILPKTVTLSVEPSPLTQLLSRKRLLLNSKEQVREEQKDQAEPEMVLRKTCAFLPSPSHLKQKTRMNENEDTLGKKQFCFPQLMIQDSSNSGKRTYTESLEDDVLKKKDRLKTDIEDKMLPIYMNLKAKKLPLPQVLNAKELQCQIREQKGKVQEDKKKIVTNIKYIFISLLTQPYLEFDTIGEAYITNIRVPPSELQSKESSDAVEIAHGQTIDGEHPSDVKEFKGHTQLKEEKDTEKTMDMNIVANPNDMYLDAKKSPLLLKHNLSDLQRKTKEQERKVHKVTCKPAGIMLNKACSSHSSSPQLNTNIRDKGKSMVTLTSPSVSAVHFQDSSASQEVVSIEPIICHSLFSLWEEKPCMHQSKKQAGVQTLNLMFLKNEEKKMQGSKDERGVLLTQSSISLSCLPHPLLGKEMQRIPNAWEMVHPEPVSGEFMKDVQKKEQHVLQKEEVNREKPVAMRGMTNFMDITLKSKKSPPSYTLHRTELHVHVGRQGQKKHEGQDKPPGSVLRKVYALKPPTNLRVNKGTQVDEQELGIKRCPLFLQVVSSSSEAEKTEATETIAVDIRRTNQCHLQKKKDSEQNRTKVDKGLLEVKGFSPSQLQVPESSDTGNTKYADSSVGASSCKTMIKANQRTSYKDAKDKVKERDGEGRLLPHIIILRVETSLLTQLLSRKRLPLNRKEQVRELQKDKAEPEMVLRKTCTFLPSPSHLKQNTRMNEKVDTLATTKSCFPPLKIQDSPDSGKKAYTKSFESYMLEEDRLETDIEDQRLPIYMNLKAKKLPLPRVLSAKKLQCKIEEQKPKVEENKKKVVTVKNICTFLLPLSYVHFDTREGEVYMVTITKVPLSQEQAREPSEAVEIAHAKTINGELSSDVKEFKEHVQQKEEKDTEKNTGASSIEDPHDKYSGAKKSSLSLKHNLSGLPRKTKEQEEQVHRGTCEPAGVMLTKACTSGSSPLYLNVNIGNKGESLATLTRSLVSSVNFQESSDSQEVAYVEPIICDILFSLQEGNHHMPQNQEEAGVAIINLMFPIHQEKMMPGSKDEREVKIQEGKEYDLNKAKKIAPQNEDDSGIHIRCSSIPGMSPSHTDETIESETNLQREKGLYLSKFQKSPSASVLVKKNNSSTVEKGDHGSTNVVPEDPWSFMVDQQQMQKLPSVKSEGSLSSEINKKKLTPLTEERAAPGHISRILLKEPALLITKQEEKASHPILTPKECPSEDPTENVETHVKSALSVNISPPGGEPQHETQPTECALPFERRDQSEPIQDTTTQEVQQQTASSGTVSIPPQVKSSETKIVADSTSAEDLLPFYEAIKNIFESKIKNMSQDKVYADMLGTVKAHYCDGWKSPPFAGSPGITPTTVCPHPELQPKPILESKALEIKLDLLPEMAKQSFKKLKVCSKQTIPEDNNQRLYLRPRKMCFLSLDGIDTIKLNLKHKYQKDSPHSSCTRTLTLNVSSGSRSGIESGMTSMTSADKMPLSQNLQNDSVEEKDKLLIHFSRKTLETQMNTFPRIVRESFATVNPQDRGEPLSKCIHSGVQVPKGKNRISLEFEEKTLHQIELDLQCKHLHFLLGLQVKSIFPKPNVFPKHILKLNTVAMCRTVDSSGEGGSLPTHTEPLEQHISFKNQGPHENSLLMRRLLEPTTHIRVSDPEKHAGTQEDTTVLSVLQSHVTPEKDKCHVRFQQTDTHESFDLKTQENAPSLADCHSIQIAQNFTVSPIDIENLAYWEERSALEDSESEESIFLDANPYLSQESENIQFELQKGISLEGLYKMKQVKTDLKPLYLDNSGSHPIRGCRNPSLIVLPPSYKCRKSRKHRSSSKMRSPDWLCHSLLNTVKVPCGSSSLNFSKENLPRITQNRKSYSLASLTESNIELHLAKSQGKPHRHPESKQRRKAKFDLLLKNTYWNCNDSSTQSREKWTKKMKVCDSESETADYFPKQSKPHQRHINFYYKRKHNQPFFYACIPADSLETIPKTIRWTIPKKTLRKRNFRVPLVAKISSSFNKWSLSKSLLGGQS